MRHVLATLIAVSACYTDKQGERNICIPGHDGLCPSPTVTHRYNAQGIVNIGDPAVVGESFNDATFLATLVEIDLASEEIRELAFRPGPNSRLLLQCGTFCVAVFTNAAGFVVSAVRDTSGWSAPFVHDGATNFPTVAIAGDRAAVAWIQTTGAQEGDLQVRLLDSAGTVVGTTVAATGVLLDTMTVTAGPSAFLATWERATGPSARALVAQPLALDGMPVGTPFEASIANTTTLNSRPWPSAFFDGAYHVVNDHLSANKELWAVIDPTARTIQFAGAPNISRQISSITPANPGALLTVEGFSPTPGVIRLENDEVVSMTSLPNAPKLAPMPDGYLLAYLERGNLVVDRRDFALQPTEATRIIGESYEVENGCAASHGASANLVLVAIALLRAARRRRPD